MHLLFWEGQLHAAFAIDGNKQLHLSGEMEHDFV